MTSEQFERMMESLRNIEILLSNLTKVEKKSKKKEEGTYK